MLHTLIFHNKYLRFSLTYLCKMVHITSLKSKLLFKNLFNMKAKGKSNLPTLALDYNDIVGINASIPTIKPLDCCISNCMTVHSN